jgi:predicted transcriptional regulator
MDSAPISQRRNNFAFILNRTPEVITAYLKKDGKLIRFLSPKQQTPEVCLLALKTTPEAYEFVQKGGGDSYEETIESLKALILKRNKQEIKKQLKKAFKLDSK